MNPSEPRADSPTLQNDPQTKRMSIKEFCEAFGDKPVAIPREMDFLLSLDTEEVGALFEEIRARVEPATELEMFGMAFSGYAPQRLMEIDPLIGLLTLSTNLDSPTVRPEITYWWDNTSIIESAHACAEEIEMDYPDLLQRFSDSEEVFVIPTSPQRSPEHPLGQRSSEDVQIIEDFLKYRDAVEAIGSSSSLDDMQRLLSDIAQQDRRVAAAITGLLIRSDNPNLVVTGAEYVGQIAPNVAVRAIDARSGLRLVSPAVQQVFKKFYDMVHPAVVPADTPSAQTDIQDESIGDVITAADPDATTKDKPPTAQDAAQVKEMTIREFRALFGDKPVAIPREMDFLLSLDTDEVGALFQKIRARVEPPTELEMFGMAFSGYAPELLMEIDPLIGLLTLSTNLYSPTVRPEVTRWPTNRSILESAHACAEEIEMDYPDLLQRFSDSEEVFVIPTSPQRSPEHPLGQRNSEDVQIIEDFLRYRDAVEAIGSSSSLDDMQRLLSDIAQQDRRVAAAITGLLIRSDNPNLVITGAEYVGQIAPNVAVRAMQARSGLLLVSPPVQQVFKKFYDMVHPAVVLAETPSAQTDNQDESIGDGITAADPDATTEDKSPTPQNDPQTKRMSIKEFCEAFGDKPVAIPPEMDYLLSLDT